MGPLIDARRGRHDARRARATRGQRAARSSSAASAPADRPRLLRRADARRGAGADARSTSEETFAPILYVLELARPRRGDRAPQRRAAGALVGDLHPRPARGRAVPRAPPAATAASPTSTSAPRGAEIGGAFGGEKETGGGREAGSDAWKAYMRRQTARSTTASCRSRRASLQSGANRLTLEDASLHRRRRPRKPRAGSIGVRARSRGRHGARRPRRRDRDCDEQRRRIHGSAERVAAGGELGLTELEVVSDSELMVKQMRGEYKIKNAALRDLSGRGVATRPCRRLRHVHGSAPRAQRARRPARERRPRRGV